MICLRCDCEDFVASEAEVRQDFRGESLTVRTPVMACARCGWHTVGNDQIDDLRKRTADAYRKKHHLLTSTQIKAMRQSLNMTQRQFAEFLRVGEASVKRWETWLVQDASSDELIRVKCIMAKRVAAFGRLRNEFVRHQTQTTKPADWIARAQESESLLAGLRRYCTPRNKQVEIPAVYEFLKSIQVSIPSLSVPQLLSKEAEVLLKREWLAPPFEANPMPLQKRLPAQTTLALPQTSRTGSSTHTRLACETATDEPRTKSELENDPHLALAA